MWTGGVNKGEAIHLAEKLVALSATCYQYNTANINLNTKYDTEVI